MSPRVSELDTLALLEEQRDDLLRAMDNLDEELRDGAIDEADHAELTDDLTRRTADIIRKLDNIATTRKKEEPASQKRRFGIVVGIVAIGVLAGVAVAASSGLRLAGQFGSGEIEQSSRDLLVQADVEFLRGDLDAAQVSITEVLVRVPDDVDARVLLARIQQQRTEILEAIMTLEEALAIDPDHIDALTLQGWILVNVPDDDVWPDGVALLDRAIALDARIFDPYLFRAIVAERLEADPVAAIAFYRQALDRNPPQAMVPQIENFIAALSS